jgi:hypothetical protein
MAAVAHRASSHVPSYAPAAAPAPPPADPTAGVPDVVEDRRIDAAGNTVVRRYERGRLLGKVRGWDCMRPRACTRARRARRGRMRRAPRALPTVGVTRGAHPHALPRRAALAPPATPLIQGGFARCFKFLHREKNRVLAGKVVDKESLHKARAKSKVRRAGWRGGPRTDRVCARTWSAVLRRRQRGAHGPRAKSGDGRKRGSCLAPYFGAR